MRYPGCCEMIMLRGMYPSDLKKNQAGVCSGCVLWIGMTRPPREVAFGVLFRVSFCVSVGLILCFSWFQLVSFCVSFCFSWSPGRAYEFCNCSRCDSAWSSFPSPCQPQLRHGAGKFGARKGVLAALRRRRKIYRRYFRGGVTVCNGNTPNRIATRVH